MMMMILLILGPAGFGVEPVQDLKKNWGQTPTKGWASLSSIFVLHRWWSNSQRLSQNRTYSTALTALQGCGVSKSPSNLFNLFIPALGFLFCTGMPRRSRQLRLRQTHWFQLLGRQQQIVAGYSGMKQRYHKAGLQNHRILSKVIIFNIEWNTTGYEQRP